MSNLSIAPLVGEALRMAHESYDAHIAEAIKRGNDALKERDGPNVVSQEYLSLENTLEALDQEKEILTQFADVSHDSAELISKVDDYVQSKINELFYMNSDLRLAKLKREFLDQFVIAATEVLKSKGKLTREEGDKLHALVHVYDMGIVSAINLQSIVQAYTQGQCSSLLDWAKVDLAHTRALEEEAAEQQAGGEDAEAQDTKPLLKKKIRLSGTEVALHANELMQRIMREEFGFAADQGKVANPLWIQLGISAKFVAEQRTYRSLHPNDMKTTDELHLMAQTHYDSLISEASHHAATAQTQLGFVDAMNFLEEEKSKACGVPKNFKDVVRSAHKNAAERSINAVRRRFEEWERETKLDWPDGRTFLAEQGLRFGTEERTRTLMKQRLQKLSAIMSHVETLETVYDILDETCNAQLFHVAYVSDEPATLLLLKDYVEALGVELEKKLRDGGMPTREMKDRFRLLADKCGHAYDAKRVHADWVLQYTDGAYDDVGQMATMHANARFGRQHLQLSDEQKETIVKDANVIYRDLASFMGLDSDIGKNPFTPLLLSECIARVVRDFEREQPLDTLGFSDKHTGSKLPGKRLINTLIKADNARDEALQLKALELLDQVIAMFPGGEVTQEITEKGKTIIHPRDPQIDAVRLDAALEFLKRDLAMTRSH